MGGAPAVSRCAQMEVLPSPEERKQRAHQVDHEQHSNHSEEASRYKV